MSDIAVTVMNADGSETRSNLATELAKVAIKADPTGAIHNVLADKLEDHYAPLLAEAMSNSVKGIDAAIAQARATAPKPATKQVAKSKPDPVQDALSKTYRAHEVAKQLADPESPLNRKLDKIAPKIADARAVIAKQQADQAKHKAAKAVRAKSRQHLAKAKKRQAVAAAALAKEVDTLAMLKTAVEEQDKRFAEMQKSYDARLATIQRNLTNNAPARIAVRPQRHDQLAELTAEDYRDKAERVLDPVIKKAYLDAADELEGSNE